MYETSYLLFIYLSRQVTQQLSSLSFQQQQQQLVKDKVIKLMQTPDEVLASKIYGQLNEVVFINSTIIKICSTTAKQCMYTFLQFIFVYTNCIYINNR